MRKIFISVLLLMVSTFSFSQLTSGYEIDITIHGLQDSSVFLAYHFGDKQYIKDTIRLDKAGHGIATEQKVLPQGIYMLVLGQEKVWKFKDTTYVEFDKVLGQNRQVHVMKEYTQPESRYFEILMSSDQRFTVTCSYTDYFKTLRFTGSDENSAFINYQRRWVGMQEEANRLKTRIQTNKQNTDSLKILTEKQKAHENEMKEYLKSVVETNKGTLLALLVNAIRPVEIPAFTIPPDSPNPDSLRWIRSYLYSKDHFFDNIDLTDERLLRTPILHAKLSTFFSDVVIQLADSINKEIDLIFKKCASNYKVFQFIAVYLFNHFRESEIMGHDAVMVKLADDIYLSGKADWTTQEWRDDLRKQVDMIRPNLIGKKAQNLVMDSYKGIFVSLYDIEKEFTILYFWEPDCGHCKEATPKLKAYYDTAKNDGVEIFAVCTQPDKAKWEKYIQENNLTWINGWDPQRTSHFDYYYNVQSTPGVFIIDRNKTIIAKKIPVENIGSFIENYRKYHR